jgi:hypothetical protein
MGVVRREGRIACTGRHVTIRRTGGPTIEKRTMAKEKSGRRA